MTIRCLNGNNVFLIGMMFVVFAIFVAVDVESAFATHVHNVVDYEWHVWSRTLGDGHLEYLNCDSDNEYCALKIQTSGSIQGMSQNIINNEVDTIEIDFDKLKKKMSIDRVSSVNNHIKAHDLPMNVHGKAIYDPHCTSKFLLWCIEKNNHFEKMTIQINNDSTDIKFDTYENSDVDPKVHDIRKTLSHELFHAYGY